MPYNDVAAIEEVFKKQGDQVAAVIIEPIAGNMNLIHAQLHARALLKQELTQ